MAGIGRTSIYVLPILVILADLEINLDEFSLVQSLSRIISALDEGRDEAANSRERMRIGREEASEALYL